MNTLDTNVNQYDKMGDKIESVIFKYLKIEEFTLLWRHNEGVGVSNHQPHDCLLNRLFKAQIKLNIKALRHWPLCGEFTGHRWITRTKGQ